MKHSANYFRNAEYYCWCPLKLKGVIKTRQVDKNMQLTQG
jgi:hypothetical protein